MKRSELEQAKVRTARILDEAGIVITAAERENIEIADFGLNELEKHGLEILVYENNDRYCAKEMVLFPNQTCPEHCHPNIEGEPGKRETFRVRKGRVWLYVPGGSMEDIQAKIPRGSENYYSAYHEIELNAGDQYTMEPNTLHWFQAGDEGTIVSEFSSTSRDDKDIFTDPRILRNPPVNEDS